MQHEPLKITFQVAGGWVPPPLPLHLDALLAYCVTQRDLVDIEEEPTVEALRALGERLPLAKYEQDGEWVWKASAITVAGQVRNDSQFFTQRRDRVEYAEGVRDGRIQHGRYRAGSDMKPYQLQIDTLRGVHRNLLGFYPVQRSMDGYLLELTAWCVGDRDLLESLLLDETRRPSHLGARRRSGQGRIASIRIDADATALDKWAMRVRPWAFSPDDTPIQAAWRAPYWLAENRGIAFIPPGL